MTFVVDGTNGLTFNNSTTQASAGVVLQIVSGTYSTLTSIASTSFTDTGLSLAITPKFSTSKILVMVSQPITFGRTLNAINGYYQLLRGSSSIFNGGRSFGMYVNNATDFDNTSILNSIYLDIPATTSSTTYKTQAKLSTTANSANATFQNDGAVASITLLEIAG
jgi:hypothetical protein